MSWAFIGRSLDVASEARQQGRGRDASPQHFTPRRARHRLSIMLDAGVPSAVGDASSTVFLDTVLRPYRSLPPSGFHIVMAVLAAVSIGVSVGFFLLGAWPVCGFFGLDVGLVYVAFRLNYRGARQTERLRLTEESFAVERTGIRGDKHHWNFQPFWLRVILEERGEDDNRLLVASHGKSLVLGSFLGPMQRRAAAGDITSALARWRASLTNAEP
jgi:uncharacterized membrane protein